MIRKVVKACSTFGMAVANKYVDMERRWLQIMLLPFYTLFALMYELVLALLIIVFAVQCKLEGVLTFTESFNAAKEGVIEGLNKIKG